MPPSPVQSIVQVARAAGAHAVKINLEPSAVESAVHEHIYGFAGEKVPDFTDGLIKMTTLLLC